MYIYPHVCVCIPSSINTWTSHRETAVFKNKRCLLGGCCCCFAHSFYLFFFVTFLENNGKPVTGDTNIIGIMEKLVLGCNVYVCIRCCFCNIREKEEMKADVKIENAPFSLFSFLSSPSLIHPSLSIIRGEANGTRFLMGEGKTKKRRNIFCSFVFFIRTQLSIQAERSPCDKRARQIYKKDGEIQDPNKQTTSNQNGKKEKKKKKR